jgi:hypothetical protein
MFRRPAAVPAHIDEAAKRQVEVVWLQPGVWSPAAEAAALRRGITLVKDHCAAEEHCHVSQSAGYPAKWGAHVRRRKSTYEDSRQRPDDVGDVAGGGARHAAGGGVRAIVDEKTMVKRAPLRRFGRRTPKPQ